MNEKLKLERLLSDADKAELSRDFSTAAKLVKRALAINPTELLHLLLGNLERKRKRYRQAIKQFDAAIALNPMRAVAYLLKAESLVDLKEYNEAKKIFRRSLTIEKRADAFVQLGSVCEALRDERAARQNYESALAVDPQFEEAHYNFGRLLRRANPQKALLHLRTAVRIDPKYALAHSELGAFLIQLKRYAAAERTLRKAISLDERSFWNHLYLANLLWTRGRLEQAEEEYQAACRLDGSSFSARCYAKFRKVTKRTRGSEGQSARVRGSVCES